MDQIALDPEPKNFGDWSRCQNFRYLELEPEPKIWVPAHSPAFTYCWWHSISCSKRVIVREHKRPQFIAFRLVFVADGIFFQEGWKTLENFPQYPKQWEVHLSRNLKWCNWSYRITCPKKHIRETPLIRYQRIHIELRRNSWHIWRWDEVSWFALWIKTLSLKKYCSEYMNFKNLMQKYISERMFSILYEIDLRNLLTSRDEHGSGLDRTEIILKIDGSGLVWTEKILDVFMWLFWTYQNF